MYNFDTIAMRGGGGEALLTCGTVHCSLEYQRNNICLVRTAVNGDAWTTGWDRAHCSSCLNHPRRTA